MRSNETPAWIAGFKPRCPDICDLYGSSTPTTQPSLVSNSLKFSDMGPGAWEPGGGGKGAIAPNFLSQWDEYACGPPLNFGNH